MFIHKILSVFYFIFYAQFRSVLKTHHGFNIQTLALIAVLELFICYDDDFFSVVVSDLWFSWLLAYLSPSTCNHKMTHKALIQTFFPGENVWKNPKETLLLCHINAKCNPNESNGISSCFSTGNIPIEGRTVDGRERETESVTRKEVKKIQVWSKGERRRHGFCCISCGTAVCGSFLVILFQVYWTGVITVKPWYGSMVKDVLCSALDPTVCIDVSSQRLFSVRTLKF